jgi:hypothetical protein
MATSLSLNDGVLVISLLYLSIDMQYQWHEFIGCFWPVHRWLLVSYFFILAFRAAHILGSANVAAGSGDFLLNLRHKETLPKLLMSLTWFLVLPLFAVWTAVGSYWLWDSKRLSNQCLPMGCHQCLPMGMPLGFIVIWQLLSYAWILIHISLAGIAWVLERRMRRTESSLRAMEDSDTISRWGQVSQLSSYTALANGGSLGGLTPDQINSLPEVRAGDVSLGEKMECSICLNDIDDDDALRQLSSCGHHFHRSCIDLWLLRRAECPLCKQSVLPNIDADGNPSLASPDAENTQTWHV